MAMNKYECKRMFMKKIEAQWLIMNDFMNVYELKNVRGGWLTFIFETCDCCFDYLIYFN